MSVQFVTASLLANLPKGTERSLAKQTSIPSQPNIGISFPPSDFRKILDTESAPVESAPVDHEDVSAPDVSAEELGDMEKPEVDAEDFDAEIVLTMSTSSTDIKAVQLTAAQAIWSPALTRMVIHDDHVAPAAGKTADPDVGRTNVEENKAEIDTRTPGPAPDFQKKATSNVVFLDATILSNGSSAASPVEEAYYEKRAADPAQVRSKGSMDNAIEVKVPQTSIGADDQADAPPPPRLIQETLRKYSPEAAPSKSPRQSISDKKIIEVEKGYSAVTSALPEPDHISAIMPEARSVGISPQEPTTLGKPASFEAQKAIEIPATPMSDAQANLVTIASEQKRGFRQKSATVATAGSATAIKMPNNDANAENSATGKDQVVSILAKSGSVATGTLTEAERPFFKEQNNSSRALGEMNDVTRPIQRDARVELSKNFDNTSAKNLSPEILESPTRHDQAKRLITKETGSNEFITADFSHARDMASTASQTSLLTNAGEDALVLPSDRVEKIHQPDVPLHQKADAAMGPLIASPISNFDAIITAGSRAFVTYRREASHAPRSSEGIFHKGYTQKMFVAPDSVSAADYGTSQVQTLVKNNIIKKNSLKLDLVIGSTQELRSAFADAPDVPNGAAPIKSEPLIQAGNTQVFLSNKRNTSSIAATKDKSHIPPPQKITVSDPSSDWPELQNTQYMVTGQESDTETLKPAPVQLTASSSTLVLSAFDRWVPKPTDSVLEINSENNGEGKRDNTLGNNPDILSVSSSSNVDLDAVKTGTVPLLHEGLPKVSSRTVLHARADSFLPSLKRQLSENISLTAFSKQIKEDDQKNVSSINIREMPATARRFKGIRLTIPQPKQLAATRHSLNAMTPGEAGKNGGDFNEASNQVASKQVDRSTLENYVAPRGPEIYLKTFHGNRPDIFESIYQEVPLPIESITQFEKNIPGRTTYRLQGSDELEMRALDSASRLMVAQTPFFNHMPDPKKIDLFSLTDSLPDDLNGDCFVESNDEFLDHRVERDFAVFDLKFDRRPMALIDLPKKMLPDLSPDVNSPNTTHEQASSLNAQNRGIGHSLPVHQITQRLQEALDGIIEVELRQGDLGLVRLVFSHQDKSLTVGLSADRPETLEFMRRHIDQLAQELRIMGYEKASFDFCTTPDGRGAEHERNRAAPQAESNMDETGLNGEESVISLPSLTTSSLDLRV